MAESGAEDTVKYAAVEGLTENVGYTNLGNNEIDFVTQVIIDKLFSKQYRWAAKAYADELDLREAKSGHQQQRD